MPTNVVGIGPPGVDPQVAAFAPAQLLESLCERREAGLSFRIVRGPIREHADAPDAVYLLRARGDRPRYRRAAKEGEELAAFHHEEFSTRLLG